MSASGRRERRKTGSLIKDRVERSRGFVLTLFEVSFCVVFVFARFLGRFLFSILRNTVEIFL